MSRREVSGFFISPQRFQVHLAELQQPTCDTAYLRLYHNEPAQANALLTALLSNGSVTELDCSHLAAQSGSALDALLCSSSHLRALALHEPQDSEVVAAAASGLSKNRSLTSLKLSHFDSKAVAVVSQGLSAWGPARLEQLALHQCSLAPPAAANLAKALCGQAGSLSSLCVTQTGLDDSAAAALLAPLAASLCVAKTLVTLDLGTNHIGLEGAVQLGKLLSTSTSLSLLLLPGNSLGDAGAQALAAGLAHNSSLRELDLFSNRIGQAGVQALADALKDNRRLFVLRLSDNLVPAAGLLALLATPCSVSELSLERNAVRGQDLVDCAAAVAAAASLGRDGDGDVSMETAATGNTGYVSEEQQREQQQQQQQALPRLGMRSLTRLSLACNSLMDSGALLLASMLAGTADLGHPDLGHGSRTAIAAARGLEAVDLRECGIGDGGAAALVALLGALPGLRELDIEGNRLHNAGAHQVLAAAREHPGLWSFRADANKITDPSLKAALAAVGTKAAARRGQHLRRLREGRLGRPAGDSTANTSANTTVNIIANSAGSSSEDEMPEGYLRLQAERQEAAEKLELQEKARAAMREKATAKAAARAAAAAAAAAGVAAARAAGAAGGGGGGSCGSGAGDAGTSIMDVCQDSGRGSGDGSGGSSSSSGCLKHRLSGGTHGRDAGQDAGDADVVMRGCAGGGSGSGGDGNSGGGNCCDGSRNVAARRGSAEPQTMSTGQPGQQQQEQPGCVPLPPLMHNHDGHAANALNRSGWKASALAAALPCATAHGASASPAAGAGPCAGGCAAEFGSLSEFGVCSGLDRMHSGSSSYSDGSSHCDGGSACCGGGGGGGDGDSFYCCGGSAMSMSGSMGRSSFIHTVGSATSTASWAAGVTVHITHLTSAAGLPGGGCCAAKDNDINATAAAARALLGCSSLSFWPSACSGGMSAYTAAAAPTADAVDACMAPPPMPARPASASNGAGADGTSGAGGHTGGNAMAFKPAASVSAPTATMPVPTPATRAPGQRRMSIKYKPLTAEQQRLFVDF